MSSAKRNRKGEQSKRKTANFRREPSRQRYMDDKQDQLLTLQLSSLSDQTTSDFCPMIQQRESLEAEINLSQIGEEPLDLTNEAQQVVCDDTRETRSCRHKRAIVDKFYGHVQEKSFVIERAEELRANLSERFPSFLKTMVRSNVSCVFWLHLPMHFCKLHMPRHDTTVILEDESGEEYKTNYIAGRTAFSGGWKKFSDAHELLKGDVLVFHLVSLTKFKVYIVRAYDSNEADGGFPLINFDPHAKPISSAPMEKNTDTKTSKRAECLEPFPLDLSLENIKNNSLMVVDTDYGHVADRSEKDTKSLGSDSFEGIRGIDGFTILVDGLSIDSDLSDHHRTKYYEICCSQNSFLHKDLLKSINHKLAAEIITQTVNIAEAIRASNISTSQANYVLWDKTLKGFELLGMNAGFIRARLNRITSLAFESEEAAESQRYREIILKKARAKEDMKTIESKLLKLKEAKGRHDVEIESLKVTAERHILRFQEEVDAPW